MNLITPLDPGTPPRSPRAEAATVVRQSVYTTLFGRLACAVGTSCGSVHGVNEDAHSLLDRPVPIYMVADGVGGGAMAAMASRRLVAHVHAALAMDGVAADTVCQAVLDADRVIAESIAQLTDAPGAATMALCAPVNLTASKWLVAWVGDCRVYRLSPGELAEPLTQDDTFAQLHEPPPPGGEPGDPARMVGNGAVLQPNVMWAELAPGEVLALCSDGVHKYLHPVDWQRAMEDAAPDLAAVCEALVASARAHGSTDDATVLLVQRSSLGLPRLPWRPAARTRRSGR
jgi:PPM family protein phosphatase